MTIDQQRLIRRVKTLHATKEESNASQNRENPLENESWRNWSDKEGLACEEDHPCGLWSSNRRAKKKNPQREVREL